VTVDDFTNNGSINEGKRADGGCENAAWFYKPACSINDDSINGLRVYLCVSHTNFWMVVTTDSFTRSCFFVLSSTAFLEILVLLHERGMM
jgi:hypothetical protein